MTIKEIYECTNGDAKKIMLYLRNSKNMESLIKETSSLPSDIDKSVRYYCWLNNLTELPKCPHCGKPKKFHDLQKGFFATCNDKECKSKAKSDANRRRVVDWKEVHRKMEETYASKHNGIRHNMQDPEAKEKFFNDYKEKHNGESCGVQSKKAKENREKTFNEKYDGNIRTALENGIIEKFGSLSNCASINADKSKDKISETKKNTLISKIEVIGDYDILDITEKDIILKCRICGEEFVISRSIFNKKYRNHDYVLCTNCGFDNMINQYIVGDISTRELISRVKINENYLNELLVKTTFLDSYNPTINERLYYIINDIDEVITCKYCNKKAKWNSRDVIEDGYSLSCGDKECDSKKLSDSHKNNTIISENRLIEFIKWQNDVTYIDDSVITDNIKYDYLCQYITNPIIIDYMNKRFPDSDSIEETFQRIELKIERKPICANPNCNNPVKWIGRERALYTTFCSCSCSANDEEVNNKKIITSMMNWGTEYPTQSNVYKYEYFKKTGYYHPMQIPETKHKIYLSKKKSHLGTTSKEEQRLFKILTDKLGYEIETHHKTDVYPFVCDVYIPSIDLYIEYQGWQGHGTHPYTGSTEDKAIVNKWKINEEIVLSKRKNSVYTSMIHTWTVSDPLKRKTAKDNRLKYLEIFKFKDYIDVKKQIDDYIK